MCKRILVMYGGLICEQGTAREIFYEPKHPYTWGLLTPFPGSTSAKAKKLIPIQGTPPDMLRPPQGLSVRAPLPVRDAVCQKYSRLRRS
jgi:oligopeptide transport system ATP-binding protein